MKRVDLPVGETENRKPGPLNPAGNEAYPFSDCARNWTKVQLPIKDGFWSDFLHASAFRCLSRQDPHSEMSGLLHLRPKVSRLLVYRIWPMAEPLDEDQIYKIAAALGRQGGLARAKKLSAARRKEIATKASKAAAKARSKKAKKKKR